MNRFVRFVFCFLFLFAFPLIAVAQDAPSLIKAGDSEYFKRSSDNQAVLNAIKKWQQAAAVDPELDESLYKIAMAYYFLGRFEPNSASAEKLFLTGIDYAKKALERNSKSPGAHYWYAVNLAKSVQNKGKLEKLKVMGDIKDHLLAAKEIDPAFYFGGPDRVLGMASFKSPLAKNSTAIKHLRESLQYAPDYSLTLVSLAEVLIKEKEYDEAKVLLKKVADLSPMKGFEKELKDDQELAEKLLKSIPE